MKNRCEVCGLYKKEKDSNICKSCKDCLEFSIAHTRKLMFERKINTK